MRHKKLRNKQPGRLHASFRVERKIELMPNTSRAVSTQQLIAQVKSLGLMIPPEYQADVVDAPEGDTEPLDLRLGLVLFCFDIEVSVKRVQTGFESASNISTAHAAWVCVEETLTFLV